MKFTDLTLDDIILKAIAAQGYETPTPIQQKAIPPVLDGEDLVAVAQTGTGKTAAFALPTIQWLYENPLQLKKGQKKPIRCLVLSPTRELASQIAEGFDAYGKGTGLSCQVIFGGVNQNPQVRQLKQGVDILVATPGRLLDLMGQGFVKFDDIEVFVLDEADRMLDMGFIHDVKRIMEKLPEDRQTLLFSATMPEDINRLAKRFLTDPVRVEVTPPATTVEKIEQSLYPVDKANKRKLLLHLLEDPEVRRALVFSRTKHGANRIAQTLEKVGIPAAAIHGNKSQGARERALRGFKSGHLRVLVATDIAARGIDVDDVTHVIQVDLPEVPEQYVHRIGRTARAGASGVAWAFCGIDERGLLKDIEKTIQQSIDVVDDHPFPRTGAPSLAKDLEDRGPRPNQGRRGGGGGGGGNRGRRRGRGGGGGRGGRPSGGSHAGGSHTSGTRHR
jgi:ATP-dependent RNA helicase RhlE